MISLFTPLGFNAQVSQAAADQAAAAADTGRVLLASAYPEWDSSKVYLSGDIVSYNGQEYKAKWWTQGDTPGTSEVWELAAPSDGTYPAWNSGAAYVAGNIVSYNGQLYKAKWWTQGETPGAADVWELIGDNPTDPTDPTNPTDPTDPTDPPLPGGFKVVGYYPSWEPGKINTIQYHNLTHINYAFAIPTSESGLLPLENASAASQIIQTAHANDVKVLLAIGGWSYNGTPLENTFMAATSTPEKIKKFGDAIITMAKQYGFDGVDMDWEHPRSDGSSKQQYEDLMVYLSKELKKQNMLLTSAVISGVTPEGVIYWDAAAHTDKVINAVDWFNVMAYDGGDGNRHSTYDFAVLSGKYWKETRKMPAEKVVLGVPFYGRPSWATYAAILQANPNAYNTDVSMINGMEAYYNGIPTIKKKTQFALEQLGGIMAWELTQDTTDTSKSLLQAIGDTVRAYNK
ncbi:glycosyl hydrolase family 18 protein [Paenibacillus sp. TH7-28]